ncbi:hypothetical protein Tco_0825714, partial [Tanacetum coccineum]
VATPRALVYVGLVTSGDARSWYMISGDAKSWVCLHIFIVILHNCPTVEILAQRLDLEEAPSKVEESQPLGSRVPLMSEEFEASKPSGTRTVSSYSPVSSDSTAPLYRSSYETPSLSSSLTLLVRKRGTCELILDTDSEGDELGEEDTKEDESSDANDEREIPVVDIATSEPLGLGYWAARRCTLESTEEIAPSTYEVGQSSRFMLEREGVERIYAFR